MLDYFWHIFNAFQQSVLIPAKFRGILLNIFGCSIARGAVVAERVFIGSNRLTLAPGTFINIGCFLDGCADIQIGEGSRLGPYVHILTGTHTIANTEMRRGSGSIIRNEPVIIEAGCWLGMNVAVLPGVTVARGCVIGAGAVVIQSTLPNGLYVGVPARRVKTLPVEKEGFPEV